jgi:glycerophosphoryl diester phosphodiesterase
MCDAPENTIEAFRLALDGGAYRIECDVRSNIDGELFMMHDASVDRTTDGTGELRALTSAQVRSLRAVGGAGGGTGSEPVPSFVEALEFAAGAGCRLLVELKDEDIVDAVVESIQRAGMIQACCLSSFHEPSLRHAKELCPGLSTAYFLTEEHAKGWPGAAADVVESLGGCDLLVVWPQPCTQTNLAAAMAAGFSESRTGFSDQLSKQDAFAIIKDTVRAGVQEVACGRPAWVRECLRGMGGGVRPVGCEHDPPTPPHSS